MIFQDHYDAELLTVGHKQMESCIGLLINMSHLYTIMVPDIKGFRLKLDYWRPGRDELCWYYTNTNILAHLEKLYMPNPEYEACRYPNMISHWS